MIERQTGYKANGKWFAELAEAQAEEIRTVLGANPEQANIGAMIVANGAAIVDVLTTGQNSRPTARRVHGGKKPRTPKTTTVATLQNAPAAP